MNANHFQLVEKRQNISAFSGIGIQPTTLTVNQQQPKYLHPKTAILCAMVQNSALSIIVDTPVQSCEANSQQVEVNMPKTKDKQKMKTTDNHKRTKWQLINLLLLFVIILWLNNTGLWQSHISNNTTNQNSFEIRLTAFPAIMFLQ